jgi:hypothetical protein
VETRSSISADHPVLEQIRMLEALGDHGMITTREFDANKADLLSEDGSDRLPAHRRAGPVPKAA